MSVLFHKKVIWGFTIGLICLSSTSFALSPPYCPADGTSSNDSDCEDDIRTQNFKDRVKKMLDAQAQRIGSAIIGEQLSDEQRDQLIDQQNAIRAAYEEALKDNELTREERREINKMLKEASKSIFFARNDKVDFEKRLTSFKNRVAAGVKAGEIVSAEEKELNKKIESLEAKLKDMDAGDGLSYEERVELDKEFQKVSKLITDYRQNDKGKKKPSVDRSKDNIDEKQNELSKEVANCYIKKQINDYEYALLSEELKEIRKQESKAISDGKLTKSEKDAIDELLEKAKGNIKSYCEVDYIMDRSPTVGNGSIGNNNGSQEAGINIGITVE